MNKKYKQIQMVWWVIILIVFSSGLLGFCLARFSFSNISEDSISAFATSCAAIGTVGTLIFSIVHGLNQDKKLEEEVSHREKHEKKQMDLWQKQQEIILFQKYQMHKSMFEDFINKIEKLFPVIFYDVDGLYNKLFPENNYESCVFVGGGNSYIFSINKKFKSILDFIHNIKNFDIGKMLTWDMTSYDNQLNDNLECLKELGEMLNFDLIDDKKPGNIYYESNDEVDINNDFKKYKILNCYKPTKTIELYFGIVTKINNFCNQSFLYEKELSYSNYCDFMVGLLFFFQSYKNTTGCKSIKRYFFSARAIDELMIQIYNLYSFFFLFRQDKTFKQKSLFKKTYPIEPILYEFFYKELWQINEESIEDNVKNLCEIICNHDFSSYEEWDEISNGIVDIVAKIKNLIDKLN